MKNNPIKVGDMFGAWLVKELSGTSHYICVCSSCGKSIRKLRRHDLVAGRSRMCSKCSSAINRKHGLRHTSEYSSWMNMCQRCHNPNSADYPHYGGRGIQVFPIWKASFEAFYMSLGPKPTPAYTIERLDFNKGYEPGNVVWATRQEQNVNKSDNVKITIGDETKTVSEWSRDDRCPVSADALYKRVANGWLDTRGAYRTVFDIEDPACEEPR